MCNCYTSIEHKETYNVRQYRCNYTQNSPVVAVTSNKMLKPSAVIYFAFLVSWLGSSSTPLFSSSALSVGYMYVCLHGEEIGLLYITDGLRVARVVMG